MVSLPSKYKAAELIQGTIKLLEKDFPNDLADNSIAVRVDFVGICRADVKEVIGSRDIPDDRGPLFGHELVGKIVFAGRNTGFSENELVTFNPNVTPNRTTAFAEYFFINGDREILANAVIKIPDYITLNPPWSPEPFSATIRSLDKFLELSEMKNLKDIKIGLIGAGVAGTMIGLYAKHYGANVKVFNRGQMRIDFLNKNNIFSNSELSVLAKISEFPDEFDVVYVVPTKIEPEILDLAFHSVKSGGFIHLYGGTRAEDRFLNSDINIDSIRRNETKHNLTYKGKNITITGAYGQTKRDYERGFELYQNHHNSFPLEKLVSKRIILDEFPDIIMKMAKGSLDFPGKVLVYPQ